MLSIDGGGVRGLAALLILKCIMQEVNRLESDGDTGSLPLPCNYFDLAGGTSTGGLICLMLFRLRMDIDEAIDVYKQLAPRIFKRGLFYHIGLPHLRSVFGWSLFRGSDLERDVKALVESRIQSEHGQQTAGGTVDLENEALLCPKEKLGTRCCRSFVCAVRSTDGHTVRLRTYPRNDEDRIKRPGGSCNIWEAARATSAAPFYFEPQHINGIEYWDGGLLNNNPIDQVYWESQTLYGEHRIDCTD